LRFLSWYILPREVLVDPRLSKEGLTQEGEGTNVGAFLPWPGIAGDFGVLEENVRKVGG
jgi:hypothetical protein